MNPHRKTIQEFSVEVNLKGIEPFTKQAVIERFLQAEKVIITELLQSMLNRELWQSDYEYIELGPHQIDQKGNNVYYCGVKIGKIIVDGPEHMLESLANLKDVFAYFVPETEFLENK